MTPRPAEIRYRVDPRCVSPSKVARRLGVTLERFDQLRPALEGRSFPRPDRHTGNYDLFAVDAWLDREAGLTGGELGRDVGAVVRQRIAGMGRG